MTIDELIALLQQHPGSTVVVLPSTGSYRYPKLASVECANLEYDGHRDKYYKADWGTLDDEKVEVLILNGERT
jgi:hypothetical protein